MAFWSRKSKHGSAHQVSGSGSTGDEHAVLISIGSLADPLAGLDEVEDPIIDAIERAGVGEFDGNEIGPDGATLFLYGPDADVLWAAIESAVRQVPIGPGSQAILRYGGPGAPENRIDLT